MKLFTVPILTFGKLVCRSHCSIQFPIVGMKCCSSNLVGGMEQKLPYKVGKNHCRFAYTNATEISCHKLAVKSTRAVGSF